ncbi:MAG TPA: Lrp/AsnC family transcriptional regulator [Thermoleophilaceae bacterium]|jgi:Lrp/AsnC family leucine-responsive transcriptional regulator
MRETGETTLLDAVDREILGHLAKDARLSWRELGQRVSLSANATAERVRRLRQGGVIAGFRAVVDPAAAGRTLVALIDVRLAAPADGARFERLVDGLEEVTDAAHVTGRFDYQVRVACRDVAHLDRLIRTLKSKGGASETDTRLALRTVVGRTGP